MKDSGVEWIGEIPEGWEVSRLKHHTYIRARLGWKGLKADEYVEQGYPMLSAFNIVNSKLQFENLNYINQERYDESPEIKLSIGDVLLVKDGAGIGKCAVVSELPMDSTVNGSIALVTANNAVSGFFLYYFFLSPPFVGFINYLKDGMGVPHLFQSDLREIAFPFMDLQEQQRIADFLDTQTADIDASIAKTQESIEEYKKLKQAVITQAVTKGIRPGRAMKDSGVEWIGEIPENWEMDKAIRLWKARKGSNAALLTSEYCGQHHGPYPVYSGQTENDGIMGMIDSFAFDVGDEGCLFSTTVGAKAMSVAHLTNKFSLSQNCMIMQRENSNICVRYFYFFFTHEFAYNRSLIPDYMQPSFRVKDFNAFPVLLPSYEEQQEIAAYLDEKCAAIDTLIEKKQAIITELEAYKKSLIYEYVTGKKEVPMASC